MAISIPQSSSVFSGLFDQLISPGKLRGHLNRFAPAKRRPPKIPTPSLFRCLVFHFLCGVGTLSEHMKLLTGKKISDKAIADRRKNIPLPVFELILEEALRPKADPKLHPEAFWKGLGLFSIDGTQFSVSNAPALQKNLKKARTRRGKAAFPKIGACALLESGLHNPVAAQVGADGESEMALARPLLEKLPQKSLCLLDRYYGCGEIISLFREVHAEDSGRHFLVRVKASLKARVLEALPDGSALVEIQCGGQKRVVREIKGQATRAGGKSAAVRLWTSLLDWEEYPALELLETYGKRWEQEGFYREWKADWRKGRLLLSHTPLTAAQEVAAMVLGCAILTEERMKAARKGEKPVLAISFAKTLENIKALWRVVELGRGILSREQIGKLTRRTLRHIGESAVWNKRQRSCARKVRQPVKGWPRLVENSYEKGPVTCEILPIMPAIT
jgi:hypothetical protein